MATNLQFIRGRKESSENPALNGFRWRYVLDKRRVHTSYWKCSEFRKGCRSCISAVVKQLICPIPDHTHPVHRAETTVHVAKQNLKRKALTNNNNYVWAYILQSTYLLRCDNATFKFSLPQIHTQYTLQSTSIYHITGVHADCHFSEPAAACTKRYRRAARRGVTSFFFNV